MATYWKLEVVGVVEFIREAQNGKKNLNRLKKSPRGDWVPFEGIGYEIRGTLGFGHGIPKEAYMVVVAIGVAMGG